MKSKHQKTLSAIFSKPTVANIVFADIEAMMLALGAELIERGGSRIAFVLSGARLDLHRPHPAKEAKRYQVREIELFLMEQGIKP